jgi:hypothetical protein
MEKFFKFVFTMAVILFCLTIIGLFLLLLKILLIFFPDIQIFGLTISS